MSLLRFARLFIVVAFVSCLPVQSAMAVPVMPDPNDADLLLWLRADAVNGVDGLGNPLPLPSNGSAVTTWVDTSAAGNSVSTVSASPAWFSSGFAMPGAELSMPRVSFNGSNMTMINGSNVTLNDLHTIIIVGHAQEPTNGANDMFFSYTPDATSASQVELGVFRASGTDRRLRLIEPSLDTFGNTSGISAELENPAVMSLVRRSLTDTEGYVNTTQLLDNLASGTLTISPARLRIAKHTSSTQYVDGDIAEILVYNRALSASELLSVQEYLIEKYTPLIPPVPEPSSFLLLSLGALAMVRHSRKSRLER